MSRSGTRRTSRRARRPVGVPWGRIGEVAGFPLLAGLLVLVGWLVRSEPDARPPSPSGVSVAAYVCPQPGWIEVAAGQVKAGASARVTGLPGEKALRSLADTGAWRTAKVKGASVSVEQTGEASGAVGFVGGTAPDGFGEGLAVAGCPGVADDAWFTGLGSARRGHKSSLVLSNFGSTPAVVDINLWAPSGPVPAVDNVGRVIPPHSVRTLSMAKIAGGESELVVQALRRRGSLSVSAIDTDSSGTEIPAGAAPARNLTLAAVPARVSGQELLLLNPGEETAQATVRILGDRSPFTPRGMADIQLKPGAVTVLEMPEAATRKAYSVGVSGDHPIIGAVRYRSGDDFAYATATAPIARVAVMPVDLAGIGSRQLLLTATGESATATVTAYDANMKKLRETKAKVAAGTTVSAKGYAAKGTAYVTVTGGNGLVGAAVYSKGKLIATLPLADAPVFRLGPDVQAGD